MNQTKGKYISALGHDRLTPFYDLVARLTMREIVIKKTLIEQAEIKPGQCVLDLACGTGTLAILIKKAHPEASVAGTDGDAKILGIARGKAERSYVLIKFDRGMSFEPPYADESFDRVVSSLFFHHLTRDKKLETLNEVRRILKPQGEFPVADFAHPANFLMKISSGIIKRLDSPEATADSYDGLLPGQITGAGFSRVRETGAFNSLFGTVRLYESLKV